MKLIIDFRIILSQKQNGTVYKKMLLTNKRKSQRMLERVEGSSILRILLFLLRRQSFLGTCQNNSSFYDNLTSNWDFSS